MRFIQFRSAPAQNAEPAPATAATPEVVADAVTVCHGVVEGADSTFRVTFKDGLGHFALDEKAS